MHHGHQYKAFDPRSDVVPGERDTGRKEAEEMGALSSQHTSTGIIDGTVESVKTLSYVVHSRQKTIY